MFDLAASLGRISKTDLQPVVKSSFCVLRVACAFAFLRAC